MADPALITRIAHRYGSQAVIVAIDAMRVGNGKGISFGVKATGGRTTTGRDAVEWAKEAEQRGAGEILLTSIDRDGTGDGFDCELTACGSERGQYSRDRFRRRRCGRTFC